MERLLNAMAQDGLSVWDLHKRGELYYGCVHVSAYRKMSRHARRCGVHLQVEKRKGLRFFTNKYRKRLGLLLGAFFLVAILLILSNFIWTIEVVGNEELSQDEVLEMVESYGVKRGAYRPSLDLRWIEQEILLNEERLSWIGINAAGSKVVIDVKERVRSPEILDTNSPANIVASHEGQIVHAEVYAGQRLVKEGDWVHEGNLLVSGIMEDNKGNIYYRNSRALIIAQYEDEVTVSLPFTQQVKEYTGKTVRRNYLEVFGVKLPLFIAWPMKGEYEHQQETEELRVFGIPTQLWLDQHTYKELTTVTRTFTEEEVRLQLLSQLEDYEQGELAQAKVVSREIEEEKDGESLTFHVKYTLQEDIAQRVPIEIAE